MAPDQNNKQEKKRKRASRLSRPSYSSHSAPPSSASSSYIPTQTHKVVKLTLTNESIKKEVPKSSVDEAKVLLFLSRLQRRGSIATNEDVSHITLIVSCSENALLDIPTMKSILTEKFEIDDFITTEGPSGCIDVLITVYGKMVNISKAAVFLVFLLSAKINNLQMDVFTLKSSTYKAHLLLTNSECLQGIKYIDAAKLFTYDFNNGVYDVFIQGDLSSMFNFFLECLERRWNVDTSLIKLEPMFGIHLDPALKLHPKVNLDIRARAKNNLLQYLTPTL